MAEQDSDLERQRQDAQRDLSAIVSEMELAYRHCDMVTFTSFALLARAARKKLDLLGGPLKPAGQ